MGGCFGCLLRFTPFYWLFWIVTLPFRVLWRFLRVLGLASHPPHRAQGQEMGVYLRAIRRRR